MHNKKTIVRDKNKKKTTTSINASGKGTKEALLLFKNYEFNIFSRRYYNDKTNYVTHACDKCRMEYSVTDN